MPSSFPGMDPYLERPARWPRVHNGMALQLEIALNERLPAGYVATAEAHEQVGLFTEDEFGAGFESRGMIPNVTVSERSENVSAAVIAEAPAASPAVWTSWDAEPVRLLSVEIQEADGARQAVTLIEILSPSNKSGADRASYLRKKTAVLASNASLVEMDLLRAGRRAVEPPLNEDRVYGTSVAKPYVVAVYPAWRRDPVVESACYPRGLDEPLPRVPIPLREADEPVVIDLQEVFTTMYDQSPFPRRPSIYAEPLDPPLTRELEKQAAAVLETQPNTDR